MYAAGGGEDVIADADARASAVCHQHRRGGYQTIGLLGRIFGFVNIFPGKNQRSGLCSEREGQELEEEEGAASSRYSPGLS